MPSNNITFNMTKCCSLWVFILISYLLSTFFIASSQAFFDKADLHPPDPYPVVGDNFTLTCSLTDKYPFSLNSSFMYFDHDGVIPVLSQIRRTKVDIVDARTIRLFITSVEIEHTGEYACYINETTIGRSIRLLRVTDVIVGKPPEPVAAINCSSDNWKDMTCSFCSSSDDRTFYAVYWSHNFGITWHTCRSWVTEWSPSCTCHWEGAETAGRLASFFPRLSYILRVEVKNAWTSAASPYPKTQVTIDDSSVIVVPWEVQDIQLINVTSNTISLSWRCPAELFIYLVFDVLIEGKTTAWSGIKKCEREKSNDQLAVLTNLLPYTKYNLCVRSRPRNGGYYSDCNNIAVRTDAGKPGAITSDSIVISVINDSLLHMQWKRPLETNGPITLYRLFTWADDKLIGSQDEYDTSAVVNFACDTSIVNIKVELTAINVDDRNNQLYGMQSHAKHSIHCNSGNNKNSNRGESFSMAITVGLPILFSVIAITSLVVAMYQQNKRKYCSLALNVPKPPQKLQATLQPVEYEYIQCNNNTMADVTNEKRFSIRSVTSNNGDELALQIYSNIVKYDTLSKSSSNTNEPLTPTSRHTFSLEDNLALIQNRSVLGDYCKINLRTCDSIEIKECYDSQSTDGHNKQTVASNSTDVWYCQATNINIM